MSRSRPTARLRRGADAGGSPEVLDVVDLPEPDPGVDEVAIRVISTAVNRADIFQRRGRYPPPPGVSNVLGLECSGVVAAVGDHVTRWTVGEPVCALLAGGGYAERVVVPAGQVMPLPPGVDLATAAALPEVACTVWSNVVMVAGLRPDEMILVHGGAGGIGTFAIQLARTLGARVCATAGSEDKLAVCHELGAEITINYHQQDFAQVLDELGGADIILDNMGASYLARNITALAPGGRLIVIGLQGGLRGELDLAALLTKRAAIAATGLRNRPIHEKAAICTEVVEQVWPMVGRGAVRPIVHTTMPLESAGEAHQLMEASRHVGKILLST
jgi:putative PIG3 family NAD(P)H quinone oxidoreductase